MKNSIIFLLLYILLLTANAKVISYKINQQQVLFNHLPKQHLTISKSCGELQHRMKCQAYLQAMKASFKGIESFKFAGGINPGVVLCRQQLGGEVVIGYDIYGENAFCKFKDGSLIDVGSLVYIAKHRK